nr:hypothetical protein [Leisingera sp. JC1]
MNPLQIKRGHAAAASEPGIHPAIKKENLPQAHVPRAFGSLGGVLAAAAAENKNLVTGRSRAADWAVRVDPQIHQPMGAGKGAGDDPRSFHLLNHPQVNKDSFAAGMELPRLCSWQPRRKRGSFIGGAIFVLKHCNRHRPLHVFQFAANLSVSHFKGISFWLFRDG